MTRLWNRLLLGIICCTIVLFAFMLAGCSVKVTTDISSYGDTKIVVKGIETSDITVTPDHLASLKCVKASATSQSQKGGKVTGVGPTLATFLEEYGYEQSDFSSVVFKASDGYATTLDHQFLLTHQTIILSVSNQDTILSKDEKPLRVLIPDAESSNWTKMVVEMIFTKAE
jgi:hypothetical protein